MSKSSSAKALQPTSSWANRFRVSLKLKAPHGIKLSQKETEALADIQRHDVQVLKDNQQELLSAIGVTKSLDLGNQLRKAQSARSTAAATYRMTKDPIKKREWARRVVVADNTRRALADTSSRMAATKDRLEMIKGDLELEIIEAEAKVAETTAYAKAGKQLQLAGETLISARTRAKSNAIEYTNIEITMEGAEKLINDSDPEHLLAEADAILGINQVKGDES